MVEAEHVHKSAGSCQKESQKQWQKIHLLFSVSTSYLSGNKRKALPALEGFSEPENWFSACFCSELEEKTVAQVY